MASRRSRRPPESVDLPQLPRRVPLHPARGRLVWSTNRALTIGLALGSLIARPAADRHRVRRQAADRRDRSSRARHARRGRPRRRDVLGRRRARRSWSRLALVAAHARHLPVAVAPAARPEDQRRDPREGADARARRSSRTRELYDKLTRARREASSRPLSLVSQAFELGQSLVTLDRPRRAARRVLADRARGAGRRGDPAVRRRAEVLAATRSGCRAGARPRRASSSTSRRCSRARITRRRSSCSASGRASSSRYKRHLRQALRRRSRRSRSAAAIWALVLGTIGQIAFYGMYLWIAFATIDGDDHARRR